MRDVENLMVVDWWWREREPEKEDDHITMVHADGTPVYEDGYGENEYGEVVYFCDVCECCEECPLYGDTCDGEYDENKE